MQKKTICKTNYGIALEDSSQICRIVNLQEVLFSQRNDCDEDLESSVHECVLDFNLDA